MGVCRELSGHLLLRVRVAWNGVVAVLLPRLHDGRDERGWLDTLEAGSTRLILVAEVGLKTAKQTIRKVIDKQSSQYSQ